MCVRLIRSEAVALAVAVPARGLPPTPPLPRGSCTLCGEWTACDCALVGVAVQSLVPAFAGAAAAVRDAAQQYHTNLARHLFKHRMPVCDSSLGLKLRTLTVSGINIVEIHFTDPVDHTKVRCGASGHVGSLGLLTSWWGRSRGWCGQIPRSRRCRRPRCRALNF